MRFDVVTLFPELFSNHLNNLPFKKAQQEKIAEVNLHSLRDFAIDKHGTVDDKPYGGGKGMLLMIEPIYKALQTIPKKGRVILLSPRGKKYDQKLAKELSLEDHITFICGRYEGIDARVEDLATDVISIGDYVLSGGELPALVIMESILRLKPGILDEEATQEESFTKNSLEHPQYTRPEEFNGMKVPEVLLSGNHKEIEKWKEEHTKTLAS